MHCEHYRLPGGGSVILCGRRGKLTMADKEQIENALTETQLTDEQTLLIHRTRNAIKAHEDLADKCDKAKLPVLAREHDFMAKELTAKIDLQLRAFRDGTLAEIEKQKKAKGEQ